MIIRKYYFSTQFPINETPIVYSVTSINKSKLCGFRVPIIEEYNNDIFPTCYCYETKEEDCSNTKTSCNCNNDHKITKEEDCSNIETSCNCNNNYETYSIVDQLRKDLFSLYEEYKNNKEKIKPTSKKQQKTKNKYSNEIIQYLKDKNNQKVGILYAYKYDKNNFTVGISCCSPIDKFSKTIGLQLAKERASKGDHSFKIKNDHLSSFLHFINRAIKYYKDLTIKYQINLHWDGPNVVITYNDKSKN